MFAEALVNIYRTSESKICNGQASLSCVCLESVLRPGPADVHGIFIRDRESLEHDGVGLAIPCVAHIW